MGPILQAPVGHRCESLHFFAIGSKPHLLSISEVRILRSERGIVGPRLGSAVLETPINFIVRVVSVLNQCILRNKPV